MAAGADTRVLEGTIYPHFAGGLGQLDRMREIAGMGVPLLYSDGTGKVHGQWVITQLSEGQSHFLPGGVPRKITFSLTLQKYGEDVQVK